MGLFGEWKIVVGKLFGLVFCWLEDSLAACMGRSLGKMEFCILEGEIEGYLRGQRRN